VSQGPSPGGPPRAIPLRPGREAASPTMAVWRGTPESPLHHMGTLRHINTTRQYFCVDALGGQRT
jgi:hypothetical protein